MSARVAMPVLGVLLLGAAIAVVWSKHEARSLFIELQRLHAERDRLDIEWGQLKLEQSAFAMHGRVDIARLAIGANIAPRSRHKTTGNMGETMRKGTINRRSVLTGTAALGAAGMLAANGSPLRS